MATKVVSSTTRMIGKARERFTCSFCFQEVEGWIYYVGFSAHNKVESCGRCWVEPRIPPMKPIGSGIVLG